MSGQYFGEIASSSGALSACASLAGFAVALFAKAVIVARRGGDRERSQKLSAAGFVVAALSVGALANAVVADPAPFPYAEIGAWHASLFALSFLALSFPRAAGIPALALVAVFALAWSSALAGWSGSASVLAVSRGDGTALFVVPAGYRPPSFDAGALVLESWTPSFPFAPFSSARFRPLRTETRGASPREIISVFPSPLGESLAAMLREWTGSVNLVRLAAPDVGELIWRFDPGSGYFVKASLR